MRIVLAAIAMLAVLGRTALDGKTLMTALDIADGPAWTGITTIKRVFGLSTTDMTAQSDGTWRYPFGTLGVDGVTVRNPAIAIYPDGGKECRQHANLYLDSCYGRSELQLGRSELGALRLFFAFKEKKLYLTAADAHR